MAKEKTVLRQAQHRRGRRLIWATTVITLAACSPASENDKAAEPPASGTIAPGTYSNAPTEGDGEGWRVTLARGERSNAATIAHCAPECGKPVSVPVRIGMGGLMAEYPLADGRSVALAIRAHGNGLEVATDWGNGLESYKLAQVNDVSK
jgi:hypothetical protein